MGGITGKRTAAASHGISSSGYWLGDAIQRVEKEVSSVIVTGVILLLLGYFLGISILYTIGGILLVIGLVLWIAGAMGHAVGGRPHYW
jgi:uncharacterized membrane protein